MKKKILSIIGSLITLAIVVNIASAATVTVGNDDTSRTVTDTRADFVIIDTNNPATSNAWLEGFKYYASTTNPFHFLIVDSTDQVKWVSGEITPGLTGSNEYNPGPVFIKSGWNIGMYFVSTGTIPFNYTGDPAWYTLGGYGLPTVGDTLIYQSSSNRVYSFVASGTELPYGVITSPSEDDKIIGSLDITAEYYDGDAVNDDGVYWAVRHNTCNAATNTVFGNVDTYNDPYIWDGTNFSATVDTSTVAPGYYCFVFNPQDDPGENDVRETRWFYIADGSVNGGGQLRKEIGPKAKDDYKISFGGQIWDLGSEGIIGDWEVNLHNVGYNDLDQTKFHTSEITNIVFYTDNSNTCDDAVRFDAVGRFGNEEGYRMIFRAGDLGNKNTADTARVEIFNPDNNPIYDTYDSGEFGGESSCVGSARTDLDKGNITIWH